MKIIFENWWWRKLWSFEFFERFSWRVEDEELLRIDEKIYDDEESTIKNIHLWCIDEFLHIERSTNFEMTLSRQEHWKIWWRSNWKNSWWWWQRQQTSSILSETKSPTTVQNSETAKFFFEKCFPRLAFKKKQKLENEFLKIPRAKKKDLPKTLFL